MSASPVLRFYSPTLQAPDPSGRTLSAILALPDTSLEFCHDYIQHLFPLPERSAFHPSAPAIDAATFTAFRSQPALQSQLVKSLARMLHFYGFELQQQPEQPHRVDVIPGPNFSRASRNWVRRFDHNHLRITRIIRCLRVLGLETHAGAFFRALVSVYDNGRSGISAKSVMFWTRAAERPLYLAPEDERDEGRGQEFLYEFEARKRGEADGDGVAGGGDGEEGKGSKGEDDQA